MKHNLLRENCLGDVCRFNSFNNTDFIRKLLGFRKPFIINDLIRTGHVRTMWDTNYLSKTVGDNLVSFGKLNASNIVDYEHVQTKTMHDFLRYIEDYENGLCLTNSEKIYMVISRIMSHAKAREIRLPELLRDIEVPYFIPFNKLWEINLWMGIGGNRSNLHFDPEENILTVLKGSKKIILFAPNQTKFLYQNKNSKVNNLHSLVDIFNIDRTNHSLIDKAKFYQIELIEGESLYIPSGWWHAVESSIDRNISINFWWLVKFDYLFRFSNPSMKRLWQKDRKWLTVIRSEFNFNN